MSDLIITPNDEARIYKFNKTDARPVFVAECPGMRFNGMAVCIATDKQEEIKKCLFMAEKEFPRMWAKIQEAYERSK